MQIFPTPEKLENAIALIEPLERKHFESLIPIAADPALWEMNPRRVENRQDIVNYLEEALDEKEKGISIPFVLTDKRTNEVAGCTRYSNLSGPNKRLEIGWTWIGVKFQKTGFNRAVKFELLRYGFETLGLKRIELKTDALNSASRNAMKKMGV